MFFVLMVVFKGENNRFFITNLGGWKYLKTFFLTVFRNPHQ